MSDAKKCDICGNYFSYVGNDERPRHMVHIHPGMNLRNDDEISYVYLVLGKKKYDICRECYHSIMAVINGRWKDEI